MADIGKPGNWHRAMIVATGIGVLGASLAAPVAEASMLAPVARPAAFHLQDETQSEPSQVGEGTADTETLDQGSPPAAAPSGDDVETLDQGSPPAETSAAPVPVADGTLLTTAPATTATAYPEPAGPRLPPGFGEGRVLVSNNPRGFPVGLEPCEVGVVSGRAYVGVKCEDAGGPVVGHSTYQDFPWVIDPGFPFEPGADVVTDPSFPFDENSPFFESTLDRTTDSDVVVLVAPRSFPFDSSEETDSESTGTPANSTDAPVVSTGGAVSLTQPARADKERNRTRSSGSASSGDVSSDPGKSRTGRSATRKQQAQVSSASKRSKNSTAKSDNKTKANNKKKDRKGSAKASKKQRAAHENRQKRNRQK